jgi:glycosyltransferase involved in cell wall biosynthesis
LDERSLFPESDSKALANRIDWWIEHPQERELMSAKYAESVKNYNLSDSIEQIIKMYRDSIGS